MGHYVIDLNMECSDYHNLHKQLRRNRYGLEGFIETTDMPVLSKERIWLWMARLFMDIIIGRYDSNEIDIGC